MSLELEAGPANRLWRGEPFEHTRVPQWIVNHWMGQGGPNAQWSERFENGWRALLWFVGHWYSRRKPYRFSLPPGLVEWLNSTDVDLTGHIQLRPGLRGSVPCGEFKPVTRFMRSVWEQRGGVPPLENMEGYYDFLAEFAFAALPASNAPAALLSREILELLNAPAEEGLPLTVGMLLYVKRAYPNEYPQIAEHGRERLLALSFQATEGLLAIGDTRLVPLAVTAFWSQRPLPEKVVTAFEFVAFSVANGWANNGAAQADQADEQEIRSWFHANVAPRSPRALLFSGAPVNLPPANGPVMKIEDRAILIYRDQVTIAGLSRAGANMEAALRGTGLTVYDLHFSLHRARLDMEADRNRKLSINARRKLHILNANPEYLPELIYCNLNNVGRNDYIVGQFFWEFSVLAKAHEPGLALVDEIWTASRFLTHLYETATKKPVITMGQVIAEKTPTTVTQNQFEFSQGTYIFLCSFDAGSVVARKNPLGTVAAFQLAFPRGTERVGLIIKTRNLQCVQSESETIHWAGVLARARQDHRIRIVEQTMTEDELSALYSLCGCFVSLHRSEGFGLGPAEAMAHGKPVIVTNYSGVCDFCLPETAKLVGYELIRLRQDEYPFLDPDRTYEWADPDVTQAAEYMRMLSEDREQGERLGSAARDLMLREYSVEAVRCRYLARLEQLGFSLGT